MTTGAKHGQSSILNCNGAYTPTGNFECYDGLDTTSPACEVQLQVLVRWPLPDAAVVSSIGAISVQPDLQISLVDSTGKVRVTAKSGFGCVPGGDLLMTPGIDPKVVGIGDGVTLYVRLPDQVPG